MNRLLLLGLGIVFWSLVSCTDKDKIPPGVLPPAKMEKVLWDIIEAERFTANFVKDSAKNVKTETFKLYAQIFSIHNITKDQFVKSYKFYMSRPDIARSMFDSLATQANRRREEMYKPKTQPSAGQAQAPASQPAQSQPAQPQPAQPAPTPSKTIKPILTDPHLQPRTPFRHIKRDSLFRKDSLRKPAH